VLDSRATDDGTAIRRRRACNACAKRFTTYERIDGDEAIRVVKRDGRIQSFDRRKVLQGMLTACEKRPVPGDVLEAAANRIHLAILSEGEREISTRRVGELVSVHVIPRPHSEVEKILPKPEPASGPGKA